MRGDKATMGSGDNDSAMMSCGGNSKRDCGRWWMAAPRSPLVSLFCDGPSDSDEDALARAEPIAGGDVCRSDGGV